MTEPRMTPREALGPSRKLPATTAQAKVVLRALFTERFGSPDRWGNFKVAEGRRVQLGDKVVRVQAKHTPEAGGAWFNVTSKPLIDHALTVVTIAGQVAGVEELARGGRARRETRKGAAQSSAQKRAREAIERDTAENGPGFYVTNKTARGGYRDQGIVADHERPFSSLEAAINFAQKRYADFIMMKLDYLFPVRVVRTGSRADAMAGEGHVYWIDGRFRGPPADPRQTTMGFSSGRR